ncbi:hypothetical protein P7K49_019370 [Saguinus oedipus]|uniref:Uncharacterized protein n=1 Tax=Saguinus oedipus TaxID=9490 RepID=A0ABQ9UX75_SAGOE|nr:hypothetical protein P7K49_019370 [Saguinus oedipus]
MAAEPYETNAFKVPSREIDKAERASSGRTGPGRPSSSFSSSTLRWRSPGSAQPPRLASWSEAASTPADERSAPSATAARVFAAASARRPASATHAPHGACTLRAPRTTPTAPTSSRCPPPAPVVHPPPHLGSIPQLLASIPQPP